MKTPAQLFLVTSLIVATATSASGETIRGRFVDGEGAPVRSAEFQVLIDVHPVQLSWNVAYRTVRTDADGGFEVGLRAPAGDQRWLCVRDSIGGPLTLGGRFPLPSNPDVREIIDIGTLTVTAPPVVATGSCRDDADGTLPEHAVRYAVEHPVAIVAHLGSTQRITWTHGHQLRIERGPAGTFRVLGWPCTDRLRVRASLGSPIFGEWVEFEPGARDLDLRVPVTGSVGGVFVLVDHAARLPKDTIWVEIDTPRGEHTGGWLDHEGWRGWSRLQPGTVRVRLFAGLDAEPFARFEAELRANEELSFDPVPPPRSLRGYRVRVVDSEDRLLVSQFLPEGAEDRVDRRHPRFSLNRDVRSGTYLVASILDRPRVTVSSLGYESRVVELLDDETTVVLEPIRR